MPLCGKLTEDRIFDVASLGTRASPTTRSDIALDRSDLETASLIGILDRKGSADDRGLGDDNPLQLYGDSRSVYEGDHAAEKGTSRVPGRKTHSKTHAVCMYVCMSSIFQ